MAGYASRTTSAKGAVADTSSRYERTGSRWIADFRRRRTDDTSTAANATSPWTPPACCWSWPSRPHPSRRTRSALSPPHGASPGSAVRDGRLVARPSFSQLQQVRTARGKGIPMHLVTHEDVLDLAKVDDSGPTGDTRLWSRANGYPTVRFLMWSTTRRVPHGRCQAPVDRLQTSSSVRSRSSNVAFRRSLHASRRRARPRILGWGRRCP